MLYNISFLYILCYDELNIEVSWPAFKTNTTTTTTTTTTTDNVKSTLQTTWEWDKFDASHSQRSVKGLLWGSSLIYTSKIILGQFCQ